MRFVNYDSVTEGIAYIPEAHDNRELPEDQKMIFWIKPLSNKSKRHYDEMVQTKLVGKKKDEIKINLADVQRKIFIDCVVKAINVEIEDAKSGALKSNPNPAEIYDGFDPQVIQEVLKAIEDRSVLNDGLKKH